MPRVQNIAIPPHHRSTDLNPPFRVCNRIHGRCNSVVELLSTAMRAGTRTEDQPTGVVAVTESRYETRTRAHFEVWSCVGTNYQFLLGGKYPWRGEARKGKEKKRKEIRCSPKQPARKKCRVSSWDARWTRARTNEATPHGEIPRKQESRVCFYLGVKGKT
jgi:hypothetical protein